MQNINIKISSFLATAFVCLHLTAIAQNPRYIQRDVIKVAGVTTSVGVLSLTDDEKITTRTYVDGLGRAIRVVNKQASPLKKDMVQPIVYDRLGMTTTNYLPYTSTNNDGSYQTNPFIGQVSFYTTAQKVANDDSLYTRQVFENSPMQRLLRAGSVGSGFEPGDGQKYTAVNYRTNTVADGVITWSTAGINTGSYAAGNLQVTEATDPEGVKTLAFKNNNGQMVLKRQQSGSSTYIDTYYIYNEAGALRNMIPPKAVNLMAGRGNWALNQTDIANLIFTYTYDKEARQVEKTIPGGITIYTVYDPFGRPVLVQDNNLRANDKWNYIKYDAKGHPISQGIYTDYASTRSAMQTLLDNMGTGGTMFEERSTNASTGYYTNTVFPYNGIEPLAYNYFDDYDLDKNGTADYSYISQGLTGEATATTALRGVVTMVRSRTVGQSLGNMWLTKAIFYDKYGNTIQVRSNNQLNATVADVQTNVHNFTGITTQAQVTKIVPGNTTTVRTTFNYDQVYRITAIDQAYNGGTTMRVAGYEYNELGQLVKKGLKQLNNVPNYVTLGTGNSVANGNTSNVLAQKSITITPDFIAAHGSTFSAKIVDGYLQSVDYRYNIRGQLTSINNSKLANDGGITNDNANDVFGMDLLYHQTDANLGNTAKFNGNISAVKWMTLDGSNAKTNERSYKYTYDMLNRLTAANYAERGSTATGSFNINANGFDESIGVYDEAGNILNLQRNSSSIGAGSNTQVDNLTYTYDTNNPNKLKKVTDGAGTNYTGFGFRNLTGSTADYEYDVAGNLTTDPYKGQTLTYNDLNRTDQITITTATNRYIRYTYNSGGQLIRKQAYDNATLQKTTDYIDGFVYEGGTLLYFPIPEGRVINNAGTLTPEFVITDHQGNARVNFKDDGTGNAQITQENSYYAFGLTMANSPVSIPTVPNKNLYNGGAEWQNDFANLPDYYQTFFRNYDQALGRFIAIDPLAEESESLTGYQYSVNNPVMFNDPLGDRERPQLMEMPREDCGCGGGGIGSGSGMNAARAFIKGVWAVQDADRAAQQNLMDRARAGDPIALSMYAQQTGGVHITNQATIQNIGKALSNGDFSITSSGYSYSYMTFDKDQESDNQHSANYHLKSVKFGVGDNSGGSGGVVNWFRENSGKLKDTGIEVLNMSAGVSEISGGAALMSTPTGLGQVVGGYMVADGTARISTSLIRIYGIWTGNQSARNAPHNFLGLVGMTISPQTQNLMELAGDFFSARQGVVKIANGGFTGTKGYIDAANAGYKIFSPYNGAYDKFNK
jgi:RHS repeat-associated protein